MSRMARWVTDDQVVVNVPVKLVAVVLTATSGGAASATIYDGVNDDGEIVAVVKALANTTFSMEFYGGVHITTGIYVDLGSNVQGLLVVYEPEERET